MANEFQELKFLAQTEGWAFNGVKDGYEIYQKEKKDEWEEMYHGKDGFK